MSGIVVRGAPPFPRFMFYVKATLIILSVAILALAAYATSIEDDIYSSSGVPEYLIFLAIFTWIAYGVPIIIELAAPRFYFRLFVLTAYALGTIFWLTGWAWSASWASYALSSDNRDGTSSNGGSWMKFGSVMGACAGLGALSWVLSGIELTFFCLSCVRNPTSAYVQGGVAQEQIHTQSQRSMQTHNPLQHSYTTQSAYRSHSQQH
ncbi:hypothetical protein GGS26DRAFT_579159 [Hypomontagnella submonticulosa]|nr:hypothetical protein GGS26DRAFT_579159 [Hypomontagnella submonticulosa]